MVVVSRRAAAPTRGAERADVDARSGVAAASLAPAASDASPLLPADTLFSASVCTAAWAHFGALCLAAAPAKSAPMPRAAALRELSAQGAGKASSAWGWTSENVTSTGAWSLHFCSAASP